MTNATLQAAHLFEDHGDRFASVLSDRDYAQAIACAHATKVFDLLRTSVYPNRVVRHAPGVEPASLTHAKEPFAQVSLRAMTAAAIDTDVSGVIAMITSQLRLHGRLDRNEIIDAVLAIEAETLASMEQALGCSLSAGKYFGLFGDQASRKATDIFAEMKASLADVAPVEKQALCTDMDGVLAILKPHDETKQGPLGFGDTRLGHHVHANAQALLTELNPGASVKDVDTEFGLAPYFVRNHGDEMVRRWGEEAVTRIREIHRQSYPESENAAAEARAQEHIDSMPLAYHVFRHRTWDHDLSEIYEGDETAGMFAQEVFARGGKLFFVTAAPRIHAVKMLKRFGITDRIPIEDVHLSSVEQMYLPGTVEDATFIEGHKDAVVSRICEEHSLAPHEVAMAGDQYGSDVLPLLQAGIDARIVIGPHQLQRYGRNVRLPNDPK